MHNIEQTRKNLIENFQKFFAHNNVEKAVIGVSGGIDSAVTLAIAVEALGAKNVYAYLLPYQLGTFSSHENFADAQDICGFFHLPEKNIQAIEIDTFAEPFEHLFATNSLSFGNSLARIRMSILFGYANKFSGLVLGTCNKSEIMLGYETKFGDGACDLNILGNLWKSEVYQLAKEYKIPENFVTKTPSAELFEDHSDEEEMGFSYDQAQPILKQIEKHSENFSPENSLEETIFAMWKNSAHKRVFSPTLEK